jgi:hypothetical protein
MDSGFPDCVIIQAAFFSTRHAGLDPASSSVTIEKNTGFRVKPGMTINSFFEFLNFTNSSNFGHLKIGIYLEFEICNLGFKRFDPGNGSA